MHLNLHSLLHICSFWHRQFIAKEDVTYYERIQTLIKMGRTRKKWDPTLQEPLELATQLVEHHSCLHPRPTKLDTFEEKQSCAEDRHDHGLIRAYALSVRLPLRIPFAL